MLHPQRMALESEGYPDNPPWHYILTLLAALIPPVSVLLLAAAVKGGTERPFLLPGATDLGWLRTGAQLGVDRPGGDGVDTNPVLHEVRGQ